MGTVNPNQSMHTIRYFSQTFNTTKASPSAVQETVHLQNLLQGGTWMQVNEKKEVSPY